MMISRREIIRMLGATALTPFASPLFLGCNDVAPAAIQPNKQPLLTAISDFTVRRGADRGFRNRGWLLAKHGFTFADFRDPKYDRFGPMRVLNEDVIQGGKGFPMHAHRDMEIITYILAGALEHKDNLGTGSIIAPGEVQKMSAGTGIRHSEFNPYVESPVHLLQIWIEPDKKGYAPGYQQKTIASTEKHGPIRLIASPTGERGSVVVRQDVQLHACHLKYGEQVVFDVRQNRMSWIQVAKGTISVNGDVLNAGDALHTKATGLLAMEAGADAELLLFDFLST